MSQRNRLWAGSLTAGSFHQLPDQPPQQAPLLNPPTITVIPYRLPDGRIVAVDVTACKDERVIDFTLADGQIVQAVRCEEQL